MKQDTDLPGRPILRYLDLMGKKSVVTKVEKREEYFVQFSPEEMEELNIKPGDKFEIELGDPGTIILKRMKSVEIDLAGLGVETLAALVALSVERQMPVDDIIIDLLSEHLSRESPNQ